MINAGPDSATRVGLTVSVPAKDAKLISATTSQGSWTLTKQNAACDLGSVTKGQIATVTIVAKPVKKRTLVNTTRVTADQSDPDPRNNTATATTFVT